MTNTTLNQLNAVVSTACTINKKKSSLNHRLPLREKKHLTSVLVSNGYPYSFVTNTTKSKIRQASDKEPATKLKSTAALPNIKRLSELLFAYNSMVYDLLSNPIQHLVRPKDPVDPRKQDGVVYKISCEWGKVYIGEIGRCIHELIKEDDRNTRLSRTQISADSEQAKKTGRYALWDEVTFIDRDPHWYSCIVKEAIHIRLEPNKVNRDSGIEISEAWMPTIRQHDNRPLPQRTTEGSVSSSHNTNNTLNRNPPTMSEVCDSPITNNHSGTNSSTLSRDEDMQCTVETSRSILKLQ